MTRKVLSLAVAAVVSITTLACSRDAEILAFVGELDSFTAQLVKTAKSAPNPSAGIDAAQKYLDDNKTQLKKKLEAIKTVKNFQVSEETKKKIEASFMSNASAVVSLEVEYVALAATDSAFRGKVERLVNDYKDVLTK
jgi:hypothetical protein